MLFKKFNLQLFADDDSSTSEDGKKANNKLKNIKMKLRNMKRKAKAKRNILMLI